MLNPWFLGAWILIIFQDQHGYYNRTCPIWVKFNKSAQCFCRLKLFIGFTVGYWDYAVILAISINVDSTAHPQVSWLCIAYTPPDTNEQTLKPPVAQATLTLAQHCTMSKHPHPWKPENFLWRVWGGWLVSKENFEMLYKAEKWLETVFKIKYVWDTSEYGWLFHFSLEMLD